MNKNTAGDAMQVLKRKRLMVFILVLCFIVLYVWHYASTLEEFYMVPYEKVDISELIRNEKISADDFHEVFRQTGVSPAAAKELIKNKEFHLLDRLNDLYFEKPDIKKEYIVYPITSQERNSLQSTPLVNLKKGDILLTFNTQTLNWRHGHCGIVLDGEDGILLEHMSVGQTSCRTLEEDWRAYPGFIVLRYPDEKISARAAEYAEEHLVDIRYSIFAGIIKKDKSDEDVPTYSHCSHIVWQAYKAAGVDIDANGGSIVTPKNLAMSDKLEIVQIYGINPEKYEDRVSKIKNR